MQTAVFLLQHVAALFLLALCCYVFGRRLSTSVAFQSVAEEIFFAATLGLGAMAVMVMVLGLLGLLSPVILAAALVVSVVACWNTWRELWTRVRAHKRPNWPKMGIALAIMLVLLPTALLPLYPPTACDATMYHLPYAKIYAQEGGIVFTPYLRNPVFPQYVEMLFTLALILHGDLTAQLTQWVSMVLVGLGVYAWGARLGSPRAGLWGATFWISHPLVLWLGGTGYIDHGLTLFLFGALYACAIAYEEESRAWLIISAVCCGLAIGSKYSAVFWVGLIGIAVIWLAWRKRMWQSLLIFSLVAAALAAPWYVRNIYHTGNPVFPFLPDLFGAGHWSLEGMREHAELIKKSGGKASLELFLKLPWNLAYHPEMFVAETWISKASFWLLPAACWAFFRGPRYRWLIAFGLLNVVFWFLTAQQLRYLVPLFPLLGLLIAMGCDDVFRRISFTRRSWISMSASVLFCAVLLKPAFSFMIHHISTHGLPPSGTAERHAYLAARLPTYDGYRFLNKEVGSDYVVYAFCNEWMTYFADGTHVGDHWGPGRYLTYIPLLRQPDRLYEALEEMGVGYVLKPTKYNWRMASPATFAKHFEEVYSDAEVKVYAVKPAISHE